MSVTTPETTEKSLKFPVVNNNNLTDSWNCKNKQLIF
jgi:hypothetical protein